MSDQLKDHNAILGVNVLDMNWPQAYALAQSRLEDKNEQHIFAFLNANNANIAIEDREYKDSFEGVQVLPDGIGVDIANWMLNGRPFTANLNGTDFVPSLMVYLEESLTIAMVGGTQEALMAAAKGFKRATPWHNFVPVSDGYLNDVKTQDVLRELGDIKPDILLVAMGSPLQEKWVKSHIKPEHGKLVFTVGALFDFMSQSFPRAPKNWRRLRVEWLYRLSLEPRRLWKRYILGNPLFIWRVFCRDILNRRLLGRN